MVPMVYCLSKDFACELPIDYSSLFLGLTLVLYIRHDNIEHDASLSRSDFALGDNLSFNETIYSTLASSNPGVDYYNVTSAGWAMKERLYIASEANPELKNTGKEKFQARAGESQLYLIAMGDVATGKAPKE